MADLAAALATRARWSEQGLKVLRHQHRLTPEALSAELRRLSAAGLVELSRDPWGLLVVRPTTRREAPEPEPVEITTPAEEGAVLDARPCPDCGTGCRDGACRCDDEPTPPEPPTAHRALGELQKERRVEPEPWGTRALRERADSADRVWRLARRHACDGCGAPASWRGEAEGVTCDLCSACRKAGVVP